MNQVPLDIGLQLGANNALLYQINGTAKQVLQVELHPEIALGGGATFETDHHINVAAVLRGEGVSTVVRNEQETK